MSRLGHGMRLVAAASQPAARQLGERREDDCEALRGPLQLQSTASLIHAAWREGTSCPGSMLPRCSRALFEALLQLPFARRFRRILSRARLPHYACRLPASSASVLVLQRTLRGPGEPAARRVAALVLDVAAEPFGSLSDGFGVRSTGQAAAAIQGWRSPQRDGWATAVDPRPAPEDFMSRRNTIHEKAVVMKFARCA